MLASSVAVCLLGVVAVSAIQLANTSRLGKRTLQLPAEKTTMTHGTTAITPTAFLDAKAELPVAAVHMLNSHKRQSKQHEQDAKNIRPSKTYDTTARTRTVVYKAIPTLPVATVHMLNRPKWQTNKQKQDAKKLRPPKMPTQIIGVIANALGNAAQQALANREAEKDRRQRLEQRRRMEAIIRQKCRGAAPGSARARRCASSNYHPAQEIYVPEPQEVAPEPQNIAPEPQIVVPAHEKDFQTRAAEHFRSADDALKSADLDGDGQVSREELEKFMTDKLGFTPEEARELADELMKKYDADGDGKLTGQQFRDILRNLGKKDQKDFRTRAAEKFRSADDAFKSADLDGDGQVSRQELEKFMTDKLGFTPEEARKLADEIMGKYDADGDGKLTEKQFRDILSGLFKRGGASGTSTFTALTMAFIVHASFA